MDSLVGQVINQKFLVQRLLGEGGMGKVYAGEQLGIGRKVAIKVLHDGLSKIPTVAARFEREAAAAGRVIHPNSVTVFDFGRDPNGRLYLAMEYLEGEPLSARIKRELRLSVLSAVHITSQLLETLDVCHAAGVVHRDLKPDNIFLCPHPTNEIVKILDYGIARVADAPEVTKTGQLIGTPFYMSPEQATGKKVTFAADLYAVGVVLVEMLTGQPPYVDKSHLELFRKHISAPIPTLRGLAPDRPELVHFEPLIQKVLAKKPEERPSSAKELRALLQRASFDLRGGKFAAQWSAAAPASKTLIAASAPDFGTRPTLASMDENGDQVATVANDPPHPGTLELSRTMSSEANRLGLARTEIPDEADDTIAPSDVDQTVAMGQIVLPADAVPLELETTEEASPSPKSTPRVVLDASKLKKTPIPRPDSAKIEQLAPRAPVALDEALLKSGRLPKQPTETPAQPFSAPPAEELPFFTSPEHSKLELSSLPSATPSPRPRWPLFAAVALLVASIAVALWPSSIPSDIVFQTEPPGAKLLLNGVERSGVTPMRLALPPGQITIEAKKEGCAAAKETLSLESNTKQVLLVLRCP